MIQIKRLVKDKFLVVYEKNGGLYTFSPLSDPGQRQLERFYSLIKYAFAGWLLLTIASILLFEASSSLLDSVSLISNGYMILTVGVLLFMFYRFTSITKNRSVWLSPIKALLLFFIADAAILAVQLFIAKQIFFLTGWDVRTVINAAYMVSADIPFGEWELSYFSHYPNNLFLVKLMEIMIRVGRLFGTDYHWHLVVFNVIAVNISGVMLAFAAKNFTHSRKAAIYCFILYTILISFSGWIVIPYSDTFSLPFTTLALLLLSLQCKRGTPSDSLRYLCLGIVCGFGYAIKPTAIFLLFALLIKEFLSLIFRQQKKTPALRCLFMIVGLIIASLIVDAMTYSLQTRLNPNLAFSLFHFLMMGLNVEVGGRYSESDVLFSARFPSVITRIIGNLTVIFQRIADLGPLGCLKLWLEKNAKNFADGTFAWGNEGGFFDVMYPAETPLQQRFHDLYYLWDCVTAHKILQTILRFLFFWVLISGGAALLCKTGIRRKIYVIVLTLLGLAVFLMLFESRARYIMLYAPYYILLSAVGLQQLKGKYSKRISLCLPIPHRDFKEI